MRVLVTGARGKVGRAAVAALVGAGHEVTALDLDRPAFTAPAPGVLHVQGDLLDAGVALAYTRGQDAVVHAAAIPSPERHAPHVVFANNTQSTFNVVEGCVRGGVARLVNISSETVSGWNFAERPVLPRYLPVDEEHPLVPQDPYAVGKVVGELLCDAAVARSDLPVVSLRPTWVQEGADWAVNLAPYVVDPDRPSGNYWAYVAVEDVASAIVAAVASDLAGHERFFVAAADTAGGIDLAAAVFRRHGDAVPVRPLDRPDQSSMSTAKAARLLGWQPAVSWRDRVGTAL